MTEMPSQLTLPERENYPTLSFERKVGAKSICGVDEAGRGPLAGPVVAAAVILPDISAKWGGLPEEIGAVVRDSKLLTPPHRSKIAKSLLNIAEIGTGIASVEEIDSLNILQATLLAMRRAVQNLKSIPEAALVDGNVKPSLDCQTHCIIGGDNLVMSISAASIIAKVTRDAMMLELAKQHPGYGWEHNQGYGTKEHMEAIERLGITQHHRRSFAPVASVIVKT